MTFSAKMKRIAGTAAMTTAAVAIGLGLGSGAAQAKPNPHPHPVGPSTQSSVSTQGSFNLQNGFNLQNSSNMPNSPLQNFIQFTDTRIADPIQGLFGVGEDTPFDNFTDSFHGLM